MKHTGKVILALLVIGLLSALLGSVDLISGSVSKHSNLHGAIIFFLAAFACFLFLASVVVWSINRHVAEADRWHEEQTRRMKAGLPV